MLKEKVTLDNQEIGYIHTRAYKRKYRCSFCDKGYKTSGLLLSHYKSVHQGKDHKKMGVTAVAMEQDDADKIYKEYLDITKKRSEKYLHDLKKVYKALKDGKKVIDVYKAFKDTGIREDRDRLPKLAIAQAHLKQVYFHKRENGAGVFTELRNSWTGRKADVELPITTFPDWRDKNGVVPERFWTIEERTVTTNVPIIPAHLMPTGKLNNYYILWEVDEWSPIATVSDPFLLRRVNDNTFIVLASWDLTDVEKIVLRGIREWERG